MSKLWELYEPEDTVDKAKKLKDGSRRFDRANRRYASGKELWQDCVKYFKWHEENPLKEEKSVLVKEKMQKAIALRNRPMTLHALFVFLNLSEKTWSIWRKDRPELHDAMVMVERVIYVNKFEGAASGLFNSRLIARDLRIAEGYEVSGPNGEPIKMQHNLDPSTFTDEQLATALSLARSLAVSSADGD